MNPIPASFFSMSCLGNKRTAIVLFLSLSISSVWAAQKKPAIPKQPPLTSSLVVISINGLSSDHILRPARYRHRIPNLIALRDRGSYSAAVEGVYPSLTLPAHASISTGMLPVDHGIYSDYPFDIEKGMPLATPFENSSQITADTIWAAARRSNLKSSSIDFPLTTGGTVDSRLSIREGLTSLLESIKEKKVNLVLISFNSFGEALARHGMDSKEALAAIEAIDAQVGQITAALGSEATFVVTSDSARVAVEREFRPNVVLAKKGLITLDRQGGIESWKAIAQASGGSAAIFVRNPQDEKLIAEVETTFREIHEKSDSPIWRIINRQDAARIGADPRAVLFLDAAPLYVMSSRLTGATTGSSEMRAASGYLPQRSEMRAALVFAGRGIKAGVRLEFARLVDVAPTVSRLLGLELRSARGRVIDEVLVR